MRARSKKLCHCLSSTLTSKECHPLSLSLSLSLSHLAPPHSIKLHNNNVPLHNSKRESNHTTQDSCFFSFCFSVRTHHTDTGLWLKSHLMYYSFFDCLIIMCLYMKVPFRRLQIFIQVIHESLLYSFNTGTLFLLCIFFSFFMVIYQSKSDQEPKPK